MSMDREKISTELRSEVQAIQVFSTSVIFSAAAVASSSILLFIPNLETLSLFFFVVGYQYGKTTGTMTVITSVIIYEMFAAQVYGTGGLIPFLLKFPPFLLIMIIGVYFHNLKQQNSSESPGSQQGHTDYLQPMVAEEIPQLYLPPRSVNTEETTFSLYERLLLAQLGIALTMIYDVITSLGIIVFVPDWEAFIISFFTGIPFFLFHQLTNCLLFATIPALIVALEKARPST
ncbi:MAG: hypothetical protein ACFFE8_13870 [Candidatus Heimdallarchaeota archaeon]